MNSTLTRTIREECNSSIRNFIKTFRTASTTRVWRSVRRTLLRSETATQLPFRRNISLLTTRCRRFELTERTKRLGKQQRVHDDYLGLPYQEYCHPTEIF